MADTLNLEAERAAFEREHAVLMRSKAYPNNFDIWLAARRASPAAAAEIAPEAKKDAQSHVLPPTRGTESQHSAAERALHALHRDIINIPCVVSGTYSADTNQSFAYQVGHRDARHAAASIASEFAAGAACKAALREENNVDRAQQGEPVLWMLKTGHGDRYTDKRPTGEFADKWIPLYRASIKAAAPADAPYDVLIGWGGPFAGLTVKVDPSLPPDTIEMRGANRVRANLKTGKVWTVTAQEQQQGGGASAPQRFNVQVYESYIMADGCNAAEMTGNWFCVDLVDNTRMRTFHNGSQVPESYTAYQYKSKQDAELRAAGLRRFFSAPISIDKKQDGGAQANETKEKPDEKQ